MNLRVAIVINSFPKKSETFIARQANHLNAWVFTSSFHEEEAVNHELDKVKIYKSKFPIDSLSQRLKRKILRIPCKVWNRSKINEFEKFLIKNDIEIVLAEFGPNGINVSKICQKLNIPYVIQFLGYDGKSVV